MSLSLIMSNFDSQTPNLPVQGVYDASLRGVTTGKTKQRGTDLYVEVEVGRNERKFVPFDDLEIIVISGNSIEDLLRQKRFGSKGDLARILTFYKINSNLSNVFYAMQASRTDFYAHQFKPVYKYIESTNGRLLIADEVGLGKTIEAGLIWLEARARNPDARRLLVICPPMLRPKWHNELLKRFDVKAQTLDSKGFVGLLADFKRERDNFSCAAICSLNSVRQQSVLEALEEFEETNLQFDLTIIDESHHLRNVSTKSYQAGRFLSDSTKSMVMLSATPIHLKEEDLFRQLRLLDAEEFTDFSLMQQRLIENEPLVRAQSLLRQHPPRINAALEQVRLLKDFDWFKNRETLNLVEQTLETLVPENRREMIEVGRHLENLNLFSSTISRTRKREVQESRVRREAHSIKVRFSAEEMRFYDEVTDAVQDRVANFSSNVLTGFALMMPQRMMASSIPAMVEHYRAKNDRWDAEVFDSFGFSGDFDEKTAKPETSWLHLEQIVADWDLAWRDSKFEELIAALRNRFEREPEVKIIVFSFFKPTLAYLQRRLRKVGFEPLLIDGDVPMEEREAIIKTFRETARHNILLSSEVGSEGIDLQFCRIIVNYDLPWNPMKVEQRIGRIDRLGQAAEKITILNFAVADTIEEKILTRLYERIGIFERSLGDLEQILGDTSEQLYVQMLSRRLTKEQADERIEDTFRALETKAQLESELVDQSALFLGSSDYILEKVKNARQRGGWITPEDLKSFVQDFFENNYRGTNVSWSNAAESSVSIKLTNDARNALLSFCRQQNPPLTTALTHSSESTRLILDSQKNESDSRSELLNHFHPLIKWIVETHRNADNAFFPIAAVEVASDVVPPGQYLLVIQFWKFKSLTSRVQIEYVLAPLTENQTPADDAAERLTREILERGKTWAYAAEVVSGEELQGAWEFCHDALDNSYQAALLQFRQESSDLKSKRDARLTGFYERKVEQNEKAILTLGEKLNFEHSAAGKNKIESQIKGRRTAIANFKRQLSDSRAKNEAESRVQQESLDIAAIVCRVYK